MAYLIRNTRTGVVSGVTEAHFKYLSGKEGYEVVGSDLSGKTVDELKTMLSSRGIDIEDIEGTGAGGNVVKADLIRAL